ncbi:SDR family oxidoreductase [soil metagenome]
MNGMEGMEGMEGMNSKHADKVALVTGATGGLGAAIARQLAAAGCRIAVHYGHDAAKADAVVADCIAAGVEAIAVSGDLSDDATCRRIAAEVGAAWGRIDVLVNNAAITRFIPHDDLEALDSDVFREVLDVNLMGPFQMTRAAAPCLRASGANGAGSVVNISSTAALAGTGSSIAYAASKAALNNLTLTLARALAPAVRVNAVVPGFIANDWLLKGIGAERFAALVTAQTAATPLKHAATPDDVAEVVVWIALSARHLTGELVRVDGGHHLGPGSAVVPSERRTS